MFAVGDNNTVLIIHKLISVSSVFIPDMVNRTIMCGFFVF